MPIQNVPFGLQSRPGRYGPEGGARLSNVFVEQAAEDAKFPWIFYVRPGLRSFATLPGAGGGIRGAIDLGNYGYVVAGTHVYRVDAVGTVVEIGTFPGSAPVIMARNRQQPNPQIAMVSDGQRAIIQADSVFEISDTDLPAPNGVCSIGGYFVFSIEDGRYFWTSIDEGTDIDALDFASAEANPDGLVGVIERVQEIVLFGGKSIEFHTLTGTAAVFERVQQTTLQIGCLSGAAIKSINGVPIFPASDGTIRQLNGYSPERISTHDVERDIRSLVDKTALTAFAFSLDGHQFYVLNSPDWTWACDLLTGKWFQWTTYQASRWAAEGYVDISGKRIVGDYTQGVLYELDPDVNDDAGQHLLMKMVGRTGAFPSRIVVDELYVSAIPGTGLNSEEELEADPQIVLRTSDDGVDWSDEMTQSTGLIGETAKDISFTQLGAFAGDGMWIELSMLSPVSRAINGVSIRYELLPP